MPTVRITRIPIPEGKPGDIIDVTDERAQFLTRQGYAATHETPNSSDPKSVWVEFAVTHGADLAEAEAMTKTDLVEQYG